MCEISVSFGNLVHDIKWNKEEIFFRVETTNLSQRSKVSQDYLNLMDWWVYTIFGDFIFEIS